MISDIKKISFPDNVRINWKKKAWTDEKFYREWAIDYQKIVSEKYNLNRETIKRDRLLIFNDQLHGQMTEDYKYAYEEADNVHYWYYPTEYTYGLDHRMLDLAQT